MPRTAANAIASSNAGRLENPNVRLMTHQPDASIAAAIAQALAFFRIAKLRLPFVVEPLRPFAEEPAWAIQRSNLGRTI
jgi:hypothetical protein